MAQFQTTPLAVDLYSRFMVDMFNEFDVISVPTALQQFFGRPENGSRTLFSPDAEDVDIDIIRGDEKLGALIPRGVGGRNLDGKDTIAQRFTNVNRVYPLGELEGSIDSNQLTKRLAGENPYERRDRLTRLRTLGKEIHDEHMRRFVRMFEFLCSQSLLTGKMPAILGTVDPDLLYDFRRNTNQIVALGTPWTNPAADILGDLDDSWDLIRQNGHVNADMVLMAGDAMEAFIKDADAQTLADNRRFELIEVNQNMPVPAKFSRFIEAGITARGRLRTPRGHELWMFTYEEFYTDSGGSPQPYIPSGNVLIAFSGARCDRYFGPADTIPMTPQQAQAYREYFGMSPDVAPMPPNIKATGSTIFPAMFHRDAYLAPDNKSITCRTQCAPIFATTQTDAFVTLTGAV
jgi:hypothetical protein